MTTGSTPPKAVLGACAVLGLLCSYALHQAMGWKPSALRLAPARVAVSIRAAAAPPAPSAPAYFRQKLLLLPHTKSAPGPIPRTAPLEQSPTPEAPPELERESSTPLPVIAQPEIPDVAQPVIAQLPKIPSLGAPPVPSEPGALPGITPLDIPGGDVAVFAVLLNDQGRVVDSKILVPSRYVLGDMTVLYAGREQQWKDLVPPLQPGELRWIEQRVNQRQINDPATYLLKPELP